MQVPRPLRTGLPWAAAILPAALLAASPVLSLFEKNKTDLDIGVLWDPLAIAVAIAVGLFAVFALIFGRSGKAAVMASLTVVVVFYYATWYSQAHKWGLGRGVFDVLWTLAFAAAAVAVVRARRGFGNFALALGIAAAFLVIGPVVKIANYQSDHPALRAADPHLWPTPLAPPSPPTGAKLPDIYFIVPDDYARGDILRKYFHYDNTAFNDALRRRGFSVSDNARSPYSDSESNISSAVNMDYLTRFPKILGTKSQDVRPVKRVMEDNRAARLLKPLGYRYVHMDTDEVTFAANNPHISLTTTPDSFTNLWLRDSVLGQVGGSLGFSQSARAERFRKGIRSTFSKLGKVPEQSGRKFVFFHTLMPHDPYIFGAGGQRVSYPNDSDVALEAPRAMRFYLDQVQYVEKLLLQTVDTIRARSKTPPVIVIQSDEGFEGNPDNLGEKTMRDVRVKGLLALNLPGAGKAGVPSPPTTVNTLRYVFNRYLGTHYPLLRAASYPELDYPYQYEEMRVRPVAR